MASVVRLLWLDVAIGAPKTIATGDAVEAPGDWNFTEDVEIDGSLVVDGDLTVNGTTTTINTEDVLIEDRFLLQAYTNTAAAESAGNTYVIDGTVSATLTIVTADDALPNLSDPGFTVSTDPTGVIVAGDIIITKGATAAPGNNGAWEVKAVDGPNKEISIEASPDADLVGIVNTVVVDETFAGSLSQVRIGVLRANADGTFSLGTGTTVGAGDDLVFTQIVTSGGGTITLQEAYDAGPGIITDGTGNIAFSGTQGFTADMAGIISLDAGEDSASAIVITATHANGGINMDAKAGGIDLTATAGTVAINTVTSGAVNVSSAGAVDVQAAGTVTIDSSGARIIIGGDADDFDIDIGTAGARTTTIGNNTGASALKLESGSGGIDMDADGDSTWQLWDLAGTHQNQTINLGTSGYTYSWQAGTGSGAGASFAGGTGGAWLSKGGIGGIADAGVDDAGDGGTVTLTGGQGGQGAAGPQAAGDGGVTLVSGGPGGVAGGGTGGDGGDLQLDGGSGVLGGSIDVNGGSGTTTHGAVNIGVSTTSAVGIGSSALPTLTLTASGANPITIETNAASTSPTLLLKSGTADVEISVGTGTPNGSIDGSPGDLFCDASGNLWVKESGSATDTGWIDVMAGSITLDEAYTNGRTIVQDLGPIIIDGNAATTGGAISVTPDVAAETDAQFRVLWDTKTYTGTPIGIDIDYGGATLNPSGAFGAVRIDYGAATLNDASDIYGIDLIGKTNAHVSGESVGVNFDSGWDWGFETASHTRHASDVYAFFGPDNASSLIGYVSGPGAIFVHGGIAPAAAGVEGTKISLISQAGAVADGANDGTKGGRVKLDASDGGDALAARPAGEGGDIEISTGDGGASSATALGVAGVGGAIAIIAGDGGAASVANNGGGTGGPVTIDTGSGPNAAVNGDAPAGDGGDFTLTAGRGGHASDTTGGTAGNSGAINIIGSIGGTGAQDTGAGGNDGGDGSVIAITGGQGGTGAVGQVGGAGGDVTIKGGTNGDPGGGTGGLVGKVVLESSGNSSWPVANLKNSTNEVGLYTGTGNPNTVVDAPAGSFYLRDTGSGGEAYINTSTGSGTTWTLLASAAGSTLQASYNAGATITTASSTDIAFTLTSGGFVVNGGGAVDFGNAGTDLGGFAVGTSTFDVNATGAITLDGSGASNLTTATGDLTLSATAGSVNLTGGEADAAAVRINASNAAGGIDIDAGTAGIDITTTGSMAITVTGSSTTAWVLDDGSTTYLTVDSTNSQLELGGFVDTNTTTGQGLTYLNTGGVTVGDLVCTDVNTTLQVKVAVNTDNLTSRITGVAMETKTTGQSGKVHSTHGVVVPVTFTASVSTAQIGKVAYLGTGGEALLAAPNGSGEFVVEIGIIQGANAGAGTVARVLYQPRFVSAIA